MLRWSRRRSCSADVGGFRRRPPKPRSMHWRTSQYIADRYHSYCTKLAVSIARRFRIGLESRRGRSLLSMVLHGLIHAVSAAGSEIGLHGLGQFSIRRRGRMVFHDGLCACDGAAAPSAGRFGLGEVDEEVLVEVRGNRVYHSANVGRTTGGCSCCRSICRRARPLVVNGHVDSRMRVLL